MNSDAHDSDDRSDKSGGEDGHADALNADAGIDDSDDEDGYADAQAADDVTGGSNRDDTDRSDRANVVIGKRPAEEPAPDEPAPKRATIPTSYPRLASDLPPVLAPFLPEPSSSPTDIDYDGLDNLELELIPIHHDLPISLGTESGLATDLYKEFIDPENIVQALELLCTLSGNEDPGSTIVLPVSRALNPFSGGGSGNGIAARMIDASRRAQKHLGDADRELALLRMRTLMSYITLFLTMEHVIVPRIRAEHPEWGNRKVDGEKYRYFHQLLTDTSAGAVGGAASVVAPAAASAVAAPAPSTSATSAVAQAKTTKLRDHIAYGKKFWSYGKELGIASLLMLAVCGTALTKIAKQSEKKTGLVRGMAAALSASQTWWAFAHGIGPHASRALFGVCDVPYTIPTLLHFVQSEPVPATALGKIYERCNEKDLETRFQAASNDPSPASHPGTDDPSSDPSSHMGNPSSAPSFFHAAGLSAPLSSLTAPLSSLTAGAGPSGLAIAIGDSTIRVNYHPNGDLSGEEVERRNLGHWLAKTPGSKTVTDTSNAEVRFAVLKTLLPPSEISPELVEFYCRLYNRRAIPGRKALPRSFFQQEVRSGTTFRESLEKVCGSSHPPLTTLICLIELWPTTIAIMVRPDLQSFEYFDWMPGGRSGEAISHVFEVCDAVNGLFSCFAY